VKDKIVLITGASSGIGKATALALAKMGAHIIAICRNKEQGEDLCNEIRKTTGNTGTDFLIADLADLKTVSLAAQEFKKRFNRLDVLINNAGVLYMQRSETRDGHESHFGINYLSHFLLTRLLLEELKNSSSARIINVSSDGHEWGKLNFDNLELKRGFQPLMAYGNSKLAQIYFTYELANRLKSTHITVNALHPGVVATGVGRTNFLTNAFFQVFGKPFLLTPEKGAATSIFLASEPKVEGISGKYFIKCRSANSSSISYDTQIAQKLWAISEKMIAEWI
jgi:NAD(P)-dependent dehydrogenase (short-subunit alcohol dehydrogenase family)